MASPDPGFPIKHVALGCGGMILLIAAVFSGLLYWATSPQKHEMTVVGVEWQRTIQLEQRQPPTAKDPSEHWIALREVTDSDTNFEPRWPKIPDDGNHRAGKRTERYVVRFRGTKSARVYEFETKFDEFVKFKPGSVYPVIIQKGVLVSAEPSPINAPAK
jgi:hypothetical protein